MKYFTHLVYHVPVPSVYWGTQDLLQVRVEAYPQTSVSSPKWYNSPFKMRAPCVNWYSIIRQKKAELRTCLVMKASCFCAGWVYKPLRIASHPISGVWYMMRGSRNNYNYKNRIYEACTVLVRQRINCKGYRSVMITHTMLIGVSAILSPLGPIICIIPWIWLWPNLMAAVAKLLAIDGLVFSLYPGS